MRQDAMVKMVRLVVVMCVGLLIVASSANANAQNKHDYKIAHGELVLPAAIAFAPDSDKLLPASNAALDFIRDYMADKSYVSTLRIEGHTARGGDELHNAALSRSRARTVMNALVTRGAECQRLIGVGFGSTKPAFPDDTPENKAKNARIVIANAALRGHAIGGAPIDGGGNVVEIPCIR